MPRRRIQTQQSDPVTNDHCEGIALLILDAPGGEVDSFIMNRLTDTLFVVIPVALLIIGLVVVLWLLFRRTRIGIAVYAIGADPVASRLIGLDVRWTKLIVFTLAGIADAVPG